MRNVRPRYIHCKIEIKIYIEVKYMKIKEQRLSEGWRKNYFVKAYDLYEI